MNGPWSAVLRGAYKKKDAKKKVKCSTCFVSFMNHSNLANHVNAKHPSYIPETQFPLDFKISYPIQKVKMPKLELFKLKEAKIISKISIRMYRSNAQVLKLIEGYEKCKTNKEKNNFVN